MSESFACSSCKNTHRIDACERAFESVRMLSASAMRPERVIARVYGQTEKRNGSDRLPKKI